MGFLSRCHSVKGPHLALRDESPGFCRFVSGLLGLLLSYDGDLRDPLVWPQESPVNRGVVRGLSGFLCSPCWGRGPHLDLRPEPQGSSPVLTWISGFLWSFHRGVRPRLVRRHASLPSSLVEKQWQASCRVDIWIGGFLSRCHRTGLVPSCFESILGVTVESVQGSQVYLKWIGALEHFGMVARPLEFLSSLKLRPPPLEV